MHLFEKGVETVCSMVHIYMHVQSVVDNKLPILHEDIISRARP